MLKWGFVLVTAYTGVIGAFLYVLGCREPLPGLHERYIAVRWRQALGSAMHCVAGDGIGIGILVGAVLASVLDLSGPAEVAIEYILGFTFGWAIFQALFMRDMAGGSYTRALATTFVPELLSMNLLMAGMIPTVMILKARITSANHAAAPSFWFVMSMGLLAGLVLAYPMNWWLVTNHLKHGMATIRPAGAVAGAAETPSGEAAMRTPHRAAPHPPVPVMALLSFLALAVGVASTFVFR